jgi:hypothetical protein
MMFSRSTRSAFAAFFFDERYEPFSKFFFQSTRHHLACPCLHQDWLHREIETALDSQRNIVPLLLEGFDFSSPKIASQLTGKLAELKRYNGLEIVPRYFDAGMELLREKYLNIPLSAVLHPISPSAERATTEQRAVAAATNFRRIKLNFENREPYVSMHPTSAGHRRLYVRIFLDCLFRILPPRRP